MDRDYNEIMNMINGMAEVAKSNTENTSIIIQKLNSHDALLNGLSQTVNNTNAKVAEMQDEIDQLKLNEEITTDQNKTIQLVAKRRMYQLIGNDPIDKDNYFMTFIQHCYSDMRKYYGLGPSIPRTKKRDFQRVVDGIEAWVPEGGTAKLCAWIDERDKRRKREENS